MTSGNSLAGPPNYDTAPASAHTSGSDQLWTISEIADEFNVTHRTLRYYESLGLLSPQRHANRRLFTTRDRVRLALVLRGRRLGFALDEISTIVNMYDETPGETGQLEYLLGQIDDRRADLLQRFADINAALKELDMMREACERQLQESQKNN